MPKARTTPAEFIAIWNSSLTAAEVAERCGVTIHAVMNRATLLRRDGVPLPYLTGRHPEALRRLRAAATACPHCGKAIRELG